MTVEHYEDPEASTGPAGPPPPAPSVPPPSSTQVAPLSPPSRPVPAKDETEDGSKDFPRQLWGAVGVGAIGILAYCTQFSSYETAVAVAANAGFVAGGSLAIGVIVGFLFGIPRTLQGDLTTVEGRTSYGDNTNLEQISDWLTKILVGVGLTQIGRLPSRMGDLTQFLSPALGNNTNSEAFALGLVVYYSVAGFLIGYLWARLFLPRALASANRAVNNLSQQIQQAQQSAIAVEQQVSETQQLAAEVKRAAQEIEAAQAADMNALRMADATLATRQGVPPPSPEELRLALHGASHTVKLQVLLRAQDVRSNSWRNDKPQMERTIEVFRVLVSTPEFANDHVVHGQLGFALKDKREPDWSAAEEELSKAIELRGDWVENGWLFYEFNRALCRVQLDEAFRRRRRSSATNRERILTDLRAAKTSPVLLNLIKEDPDLVPVREWMDLNGVELESL